MRKRKARLIPLIGGSVVLIGSGVGISSAMSTSKATSKAPVVSAARAPFVAFARQDAQMLCSSFTPMATRALASEETASSCAARVRKALADAEPIDERRAWKVANAIKVGEINIHGARASVTIRYVGHPGKLKLTLVRKEGRWLITTRPILKLVAGCHGRPGATGCPKDARIVVFGFSE